MDYSHTWRAPDFYRELVKLNPKIQVRSAGKFPLNGLYFKEEFKPARFLCAIDKFIVPFFGTTAKDGSYEFVGVQRIMNVLLHAKALSTSQVRKLYPGFFEMNGSPKENIKRVNRKEERINYLRSMKATSAADIHEVAKDIIENSPDEVKAIRSKYDHKWGRITGSNPIYC